MATIAEKLRALGIGVKSPEQQAREADPVLRAQFERRQPTYDEIMQSRQMRARAQVTPSDVAPMDMPEPYAPQSYSSDITGVQALAPMGLFTSPDTAPPNPIFNTDRVEVDPRLEAQYAMDERGMTEGDRQIEAQLQANAEGREEFFDSMAQPFRDAYDWANEANQSYDIWNSAANWLRDASESTAIWDSITGPIKQRMQRDAAEAQRQKEMYEEKLRQKRMQEGSNLVIEMENQLMRQLKEQEDARDAANALAFLEDKAGAANAELDRINEIIRNNKGTSFYSTPDYYAAQSQADLESAMSRRPDIYDEYNPFARPEYYDLGGPIQDYDSLGGPMQREEFIDVNGQWMPYKR